MSELADRVFPPQEFLDRLNSQRAGPPLTVLDPLAMALWHLASEPPPAPLAVVAAAPDRPPAQARPQEDLPRRRAGMTAVQGSCPMGCGEGLTLGEGGQLWCASLLCPRPDAAAQILADAETGHIIRIWPEAFTIRHPLRERLDDELMTCALHQFLAGPGPWPQVPGRYRVTVSSGTDMTWELLE